MHNKSMHNKSMHPSIMLRCIVINKTFYYLIVITSALQSLE